MIRKSDWIYLLILCLAASSIAAILLSVWVREESLVYLVSFLIAALGAGSAIVGGVAAVGYRRQALLLTLAPTIVFVVLSCSHWPLKLAFHFYEDEFEAIARSLENGEVLQTPTRVGPFRIQEVGRRSDGAVPYLDVRGRKGEIVGFVRHPLGEGFNLWSCITLTDNWSFIAED